MPRKGRGTTAGLPRIAQRFLRSGSCGEADLVVHRFHCWMDHRGLALSTLAARDVRLYLGSKLRKAEAQETGYDFTAHLTRYLDWLHDRHKLAFDPQELRAPCRRRLPVTVERYLKEIAIAARPRSWKGVRSDLRAFHRWLFQRDLTLRGLSREHAVEWLAHLAEQGLHPSTRRGRVVNVRSYLSWLHDQRLIHRDPSDLLRSTDHPKLPRYLPRPFSPEVDQVLQRRLAAAPDVPSQGLLLMRWTGLRIGELLALPHACTTRDEAGRAYLKVPLGKLLTERLVPLDARATTLVAKLQQRGAAERRWLLEEKPGKKPSQIAYQAALRAALADQRLTEPPTTHRLRHTYATELLNAGMSLVGVMGLLGHKDHRMTLRYAAVLPETVGSEYHKALAQIEAKYSAEPRDAKIGSSTQMLADVLKRLRSKRAAAATDEAGRLASLVRRLDAIMDEVHMIEQREVNR